MKKNGRPSIYSQKLASELCKILSQGISLRRACEMKGMPDASTVFRWLADKQDFREQYARAKEESADAQHEILSDLGDEAIKLSQIVDPKSSGAVVQAVKLKADNMKWSMSKMKPKKYGDKLDLTTDGKALPQPIYGGTASTGKKV